MKSILSLCKRERYCCSQKAEQNGRVKRQKYINFMETHIGTRFKWKWGRLNEAVPRRDICDREKKDMRESFSAPPALWIIGCHKIIYIFRKSNALVNMKYANQPIRGGLYASQWSSLRILKYLYSREVHKINFGQNCKCKIIFVWQTVRTVVCCYKNYTHNTFNRRHFFKKLSYVGLKFL